MVYGIAGVAVENLEEDGSKKFDQGISGTGSDCCEHFLLASNRINLIQ
jgi:hypothetical protein